MFWQVQVPRPFFVCTPLLCSCPVFYLFKNMSVLFPPVGFKGNDHYWTYVIYIHIYIYIFSQGAKKANGRRAFCSLLFFFRFSLKARGIGSTAAASGSVCMRYGSWDPSEVLDGFLPADGGLDRACRGQNRSDMRRGRSLGAGGRRSHGDIPRAAGCFPLVFSFSLFFLWGGGGCCLFAFFVLEPHILGYP